MNIPEPIDHLQPIIKWLGGKRKLLDTLIPLMPEDYHRYLEPFIGGASVLLRLHPEHAIINDINAELMNMYTVVMNNPDALMDEISKYHNTKEEYYEIRAWDRKPGYASLNPIIRAARFIYLNHTCFNGLYRTNRKGYHNASYGYYQQVTICEPHVLTSLHDYLHGNDIRMMNGDYHDVLSLATPDDFVYLDPPYMARNDSESFLRYDKRVFGVNQQKELKEACDDLNSRGVGFMQSNSDTPMVNDMYRHYHVRHISTMRTISNASKAKQATEVVITNY